MKPCRKFEHTHVRSRWRSHIAFNCGRNVWLPKCRNASASSSFATKPLPKIKMSVAQSTVSSKKFVPSVSMTLKINSETSFRVWYVLCRRAIRSGNHVKAMWMTYFANSGNVANEMPPSSLSAPSLWNSWTDQTKGIWKWKQMMHTLCRIPWIVCHQFNKLFKIKFSCRWCH